MKKSIGLAVGVIAAALTLGACSSSNPVGSTTSSPVTSSSDTSGPATSSAAPSSATVGSSTAPAGAGGPIVVGSANFPENAVIANIYADVLKAKGIAASTHLNIGNREAYIKALNDGSIDLVPEYSGTLLQYYDKTATAFTPDDVYTALQKALPATLTVLAKSTAEDSDAVVVTKATADKYKLVSIADLKPYASQLVLGGPPEWATRPTGVPGLLKLYGLTFKSFKALDASGPLTIGALKNGTIQAGNIFSTDPSVSLNNFVPLTDPNHLFAAQNVLPLITKAKVTPTISAALDAVSAKLTTASLITLVGKAVNQHEDTAQVAQEWVTANGLG